MGAPALSAIQSEELIRLRRSTFPTLDPADPAVVTSPGAGVLSLCSFSELKPSKLAQY